MNAGKCPRMLWWVSKGWYSRARLLDQPVLDVQPLNSSEVLLVVGRDPQAVCEGGCSDEDVRVANELPARPEIGLDVGSTLDDALSQRQHVRDSAELVERSDPRR